MALQVFYLRKFNDRSLGSSTVEALTPYFIIQQLEVPSQTVLIPYAPSADQVTVILCSADQSQCKKLIPNFQYYISGNTLQLTNHAFSSGFAEGMQVMISYPSTSVEISEPGELIEAVYLRTTGEKLTNVQITVQPALDVAGAFLKLELYDQSDQLVEKVAVPELDTEGVMFTCKVKILPEFFDVFNSGDYPLVVYNIDYTE